MVKIWAALTDYTILNLKIIEYGTEWFCSKIE